LHAENAALERAQEDVRRAEARRDAGVETEANVLAFRVRVADIEARRASAEAEQHVARAALNALIVSPLDETRPLAPLSAPPARGDMDAAALERDALAKRPELRQAAIRRSQARTGGSLARAALWPQVAVQGIAEANGATFADRSSAWTVGFQVRWNVFAGGADKARVDEAAANQRRADAEIEQLETAVRLEVRTAVATYRSAIDRELVSRRMVEQALESQRIIRDRYEAGLAPASDVLRAAELLARAEAGRTAAIVDAHVTAAALDRAVGRERE
jgi:outer membrane protein TolC